MLLKSALRFTRSTLLQLPTKHPFFQMAPNSINRFIWELSGVTQKQQHIMDDYWHEEHDAQCIQSAVPLSSF